MNASAERVKPWWVPSCTRIAGKWWLLLAVPLLWAEYVTGTYMDFPLVYVVPVCLAAWYSGRFVAFTLALGVPLAHLAFAVLDGRPIDLVSIIGREALRTTVVAVLVLWLARLSEYERVLQEEVRTLRGRLLPICSFCKSIKNDEGHWERLERFISKRSQTQFSHCVCPSCRQVHYFGLFDDEEPAPRKGPIALQ